jgi:hypothetical protein
VAFAEPTRKRRFLKPGAGEPGRVLKEQIVDTVAKEPDGVFAADSLAVGSSAECSELPKCVSAEGAVKYFDVALCSRPV